MFFLILIFIIDIKNKIIRKIIFCTHSIILSLSFLVKYLVVSGFLLILAEERYYTNNHLFNSMFDKVINDVYRVGNAEGRTFAL